MWAGRAKPARTHVLFCFQFFPCGERRKDSQHRAEAVIPSKALVHTGNYPTPAGAVCHQGPSGIDSEGSVANPSNMRLTSLSGAELLRRSKAGGIDPKFDCKPHDGESSQRHAVGPSSQESEAQTTEQAGGKGRDRPEIRSQNL